jgi:hypothetical protein
MDLLGQDPQLLGKCVDLLGEISVLLQQIGLKLRELISVLRRRLLIRFVRPCLRLLRDDHQGASEERYGRENKVEQNPRLGIELLALPDVRDWSPVGQKGLP